MIVYQCDASGFLVSSIELNDSDRDPLNPSAFLIPGGCVPDGPPEAPSGFRARWDGASWGVEPYAAADPAPQETAAPTVPTVVTMRQARLALLAAGKLAAANAAVAAAGEAVQIAWEFSSDVRRDNPLVTSLAQALSLDDAALDALFTQAAAL